MFVSKNIKYKTKDIQTFYSSHRIKWGQFYPSEKAIFDSLAINSDTHILHLGCGFGGGLGLALAERFFSESYADEDISCDAIALAKQITPNATFISGDNLELSDEELPNSAFDIAVSLSCVD